MQKNIIPATMAVARSQTVPCRENPRKNRDYIISIRNSRPFSFSLDDIKSVKGELITGIRYVPDRLICDTKQIEAYFNQLASQPSPGLEELANEIADDFSNELIPRWIRVDLTLSGPGFLLGAHVEDKQPLWNNQNLLHR